MFKIKALVVTDILADILPTIESNIRNNTSDTPDGRILTFAAGRDCEPVNASCDLIYANLPLIMADGSELEKELATTTLTDARVYSDIQTGPDDMLARWSLLPQLGFLLSAKDKLTPGGSVITLIGGRVPDAAIDECFKRAGMDYERGTVSIMRQSDEEYVAQYAEYERQLDGDTFEFYDESQATKILADKGYRYPSIVVASSDEIRELLKSTKLSAEQAWNHITAGNHVGHLAFGFRASPRA